VLWTQSGRTNTPETARLALKRARELGLKHLVAASNTGYTLKEILDHKAEIWPDGALNLVGVTHHSGFREPGQDEMDAQVRGELGTQGVRLLTTTHLFGNVERAVTRKWGGLYPGGLISATLRMFGQGMKVCLEVATMALDAGLVPYGEEIVALGGTGQGADTAVVIRPAHSHSFFEGAVLEIICRPRGG